LGDDIYLGAENQFNLFTLARNVEAAAEEDRARLERVGGWHLGDFVNTFQTGSLVMNLPVSPPPNKISECYPVDLIICWCTGW
jgi:DNA damage-binding protein 1